MGIKAPLAVQIDSIEPIMNGEDVIIQSRTGSGKSLAFLLPILSKYFAKISKNEKADVSAIIVPSRELAYQLVSVLNELLYNVEDYNTKQPLANTFFVTLLPDHNTTFDVQVDNLLRKRPNLIITMPSIFHSLCLIIDKNNDPTNNNDNGKNNNNNNNNKDTKQIINFSEKQKSIVFQLMKSIKMIVLDEADELIKPLARHATLKEKINRSRHPKATELILKLILKISKGIQLICSSATVNTRLTMELHQYGFIHPIKIKMEDEYSGPNTVQHAFYISPPDKKIQILCNLYSKLCFPKPALVIIDGASSIQSVEERISSYGVNVKSLYKVLSNPSEKEREEFKKEFNSGKIQMALATEDSIRGIDFVTLEYVFLLAPAKDANSYLHLSGRTGRLNNKGVAVSIITDDELSRFDQNAAYLNLKTRRIEI